MSDNRTDLPPPSAPNFNQRLRETIQTYLGRQGNPLDRGLTLRDLIETGVLKIREGFQLKPGSGGSVPLEPGDGVVDVYEPDLTPPPTPTTFTATPAISHVLIEHEPPLYTQGHGHLRTRLYGKIVNAGDPLPTFADAVEIGQFSGTVYAHPSNPATTWRFWIKWESVDGVLSANPAGGTNGVAATTGQDVSSLLTALTNQITESQLYSSLGSRINLIDGFGPGSVNARVGSVQSQIDTLAADVAQLSQTPAYDPTVTYAANDLVTYNGGLYKAIQATTGNLPTNTTYWTKIGDYASLSDAVTAHAIQLQDHETRVTATETGLAAETSARQLLATTVANNTSAIQTEATTRATADSALSSSITTLTATANAKNKTYSQAEAPSAGMVTGDIWFDSDDNNKAYRYSGSAWVATDDTRIASNTAAIVAEQTARANADSALASDITTLSSTVSGNYGTLNAAIQTEATTRADADAAEASARQTLQSTVEANNATLTAAIQTEATTRATETGSLFAQYTVKVDLAGHVSGYGLASTANGSAPTSQFGVRANQFFVAPPSVNQATAPTTDLYKGYVWVDTSVTPNVTKYYNGSAWSTTPQALPFIVQANPTTINEVDVPAGVYMDDAYIKNGTITNAKIGNAAIDDAKITNLSASKLTAGSIAVGQWIASANYVSGNQGWAIWGNGNAEFGAASIRGQLASSQINTEGLTIKHNGQVILGAGASLPAQFVTPDGGWLNSNLVPSINAAATTATWSGVSGAGKPADGATSGSNLVRKPNFADGSMGGWNGSGICSGCHDGLGEITVTSRDTLEIGNDFFVTPGETLFFAADIYTGNSSYNASAGVAFQNSSGQFIHWAGTEALGPWQYWTRKYGSTTVPAGAVKATPWLQIDGPGGQQLPYVAFSQIYVGRQQEGATVGAPAGTYVGSIPAQSVESQSGAQSRADNAANWAVSAAQTYAAAQAELARINANAHADGVVSAAEQRAINDATNKANAARASAIASTSSGANLCPNADFSSGTAGWTVSSNTFGANFGINGAGADWAVNAGVGDGATTASIHQNNSTGWGYFEIVSEPIPVEAGKRYCVSAYTGAHRAATDVFAYWAGPDGNYVGHFGADVEYNSAQYAGGQQLANYKRQQQFGIAPSNATNARVALRKHATMAGHNDSWAFIARVQFEQVGLEAASAGPWCAPGVSSGIQTIITNKANDARNAAVSDVTPSINAKLSKAGDTISGRISFSVADGMFAGSDTNNGVYFGKDGLVGRKWGNNTFYINTAGDAVFSGTIDAATMNSGRINLQHSGGWDWGYARSYEKYWDDGQNGWTFGRHADGSTLAEIKAGSNRIWMSSWNDCGIQFPGITMTNGGLTISQANVINTLQIADQAVTIPVSAYTESSDSYTGSNVEKTIQTITFTSSGAPVLVTASCEHACGNILAGSGDSTYYADQNSTFRLYRNNVLLQAKSVGSGTVYLQALDTPGSGSVTYQLRIHSVWNYGTSGSKNALSSYRALNCLEVKR